MTIKTEEQPKETLIEFQLENHKKKIAKSKELKELLKIQENFKHVRRDYMAKEREYNNKVRPFNEKTEDDADEERVKEIDRNIADSEEHIKMLTEQLNNKSKSKSYTG